MTTQSTKRPDNDKFALIWSIGLFTLTLIAVDIWYSDFHGMFSMWWSKGLWVFSHIAVLAGIIIVWVEKEDPNFDILRKWVLYAILPGTIIFVCAFRASFNEDKMMNEDIQKNKIENRIEDSIYQAKMHPKPDSIKLK
jgi:hypothetical protein